jgi:CopG family nickel-responsive transcriptional regulator
MSGSHINEKHSRVQRGAGSFQQTSLTSRAPRKGRKARETVLLTARSSRGRGTRSHARSSSPVVRFGISLEKELLAELDGFVVAKGFPTRSEAVRVLVRERLVEGEWLKGKEVAGAIVLVYDHGRREIVSKLTRVQHEFHKTVLSTQHVHLDHDNCLEVVVVKGKPVEVQKLYKGLQAIKGMKHVSLSAGTTGRGIP